MSQKTNVAIIDEYIRAVNALDLDGMIAAFAPDAIVNDARREFSGTDEIRRWLKNEIFGDNIKMDVTNAKTRGAETVVQARYDGTYDKTGLPPVLILTHYFVVREGKISTMIILFNRPNTEPSRG